jgi:hypothetical protein
VYALHVNRREVFVVSQMRVIDMERRDCCGMAPETWEAPAYPGHGDWSMLGADGCGAEAVHVDATPVRFDVPIPGDLLARLTTWYAIEVGRAGSGGLAGGDQPAVRW